MFKKLHIQMTFFCTAITSAILLILSALCLFISHNSLKKNNYSTFLNNIYSIFTNLENQTTISHQWIAQTEKNHNYTISILDNGIPLFFDQLKHNNTDAQLIEQAILKAKELHFDITRASDSSIGAQHIEFSLIGDNKEEYYVSAAALPKSSGRALGAIILYPLKGEKAQLRQQTILFGALDCAAICLLMLFSWFFTKRMIMPLEENQKKQTQFIASASHELRTPLAVILSCTEALKKADPNQAQQFQDSICSESRRMSHLINEMLLLANSDCHAWTMHFSEVELDTLLLDIYEKYTPLAAQKNIRLKINLQEGSISPIKGDQERLEQVLSILISNALDYTPYGGYILLKLEAHEKEIAIHVIDNGPGIPDEQKKKIFERFYRTDAARHERGHFGLGLCVAKEIITLHKGKLYAADSKNGGSDFVLTLKKTLNEIH